MQPQPVTSSNAGMPMGKLATDPPVSEKQRRAMFAALHGRSTLGISKAVAEKFVGSGHDADPLPTLAAGVALKAPDGDYLFVRKNNGDWEFPGGMVEQDETPEAAALRELEEELGFLWKTTPLSVKMDENAGYATYRLDVPEKFVPTLNDELTGYAWANPDNAPHPLHPGVEMALSRDAASFENIRSAVASKASDPDALAAWIKRKLDPSWNPSADDEHAITANLKMPGFEKLNAPTHPNGTKPGGEALDAKLTKESVNYSEGKGSERCRNCRHFNGTDACELVAGPIGAEDWCEKFAPDVTGAQDADIFALDQTSVRNKDIDGHLHVAMANISKANVCPYLGREIPDWQSLGLQPDKIYNLLRDPEELKKAADTFNGLKLLITHKPTSADEHESEIVIGSTGSEAKFKYPYLQNSLVVWPQDAIDLIESNTQKQLSSAYRYRADMTPGNYHGTEYDGVMRDIVGNHVALVRQGRAGADVVIGDSADTIANHQTEKATMPMLSRQAAMAQGALTVYLRPKLAQDAQLPDLSGVLASITAKNYADKIPDMTDGITKALKGVKLAKDAKFDDLEEILKSIGSIKLAADEDDEEKRKAEAEDEDDEEEEKKKKASDRRRGASDQPPDFEGKPKTGAEDDDDEDEEKKNKAMDEAIQTAVAAAQKAAAKEARELREAEKFVRPWVGEIAVACDSAEEVYRTALKILGVEGVSKLHPAALPHVLKAQPIPGSRKKDSGSSPSIATDAASIDSFNKRFPNAQRIRILG